MLLIIAAINFGRLNKIRVKSKRSRNEKKGQRKAYSAKKWSGARRPAGPATTALLAGNELLSGGTRGLSLPIYLYWSIMLANICSRQHFQIYFFKG